MSPVLEFDCQDCSYIHYIQYIIYSLRAQQLPLNSLINCCALNKCHCSVQKILTLLRVVLHTHFSISQMVQTFHPTLFCTRKVISAEMSEKFDASTVGAKSSWAVLQPKCCPMLLLASVKLTCAVMGLVVGVFPFTASLEQFVVASATSMLVISGLTTATLGTYPGNR